ASLNIHNLRFSYKFFVIFVKKIVEVFSQSDVIAQCKKPTRKWHIWFFPTLKPTLKKPKEPFFCQRSTENKQK
ncbi:hypothetical protein, partial [Flavobacterium filum]|uniref:hypothetical protein n=1 Tax=Flavobacterium filum TaxID=370974 RepID=UPI001B7FB7F5